MLKIIHCYSRQAFSGKKINLRDVLVGNFYKTNQNKSKQKHVGLGGQVGLRGRD